MHRSDRRATSLITIEAFEDSSFYVLVGDATTLVAVRFG